MLNQLEKCLQKDRASSIFMERSRKSSLFFERGSLSASQCVSMIKLLLCILINSRRCCRSIPEDLSPESPRILFGAQRQALFFWAFSLSAQVSVWALQFDYTAHLYPSDVLLAYSMSNKLFAFYFCLFMYYCVIQTFFTQISSDCTVSM
jgi:hypothetical protein